LDQPEELTEQMRLSESLINSKVNLDQQVQLTEEDQNDILMIGGIGIFLPFAQEEAENCVADDATTTIEEQSQLVDDCQGGIGADFGKDCPSRNEKENERSEEQLNDFSQQAEKL
jgi:hypothetical protein